MICGQPHLAEDDGSPPRRWEINHECDDCPPWADNPTPPDPNSRWVLREVLEQEREKPQLFVIEGDKAD